jgi:CHAT domain-containing protein
MGPAGSWSSVQPQVPSNLLTYRVWFIIEQPKKSYRDGMVRRSTLATLALGSTLCLAGCQPQGAVSIEDAKKITASFQGQDFVAPPRTITDITAILDQQKPDPAKAAANRAAAERQPPAGVGSAELARFYFARGLAAGELGLTRQRVADLREAARLGREANTDVSRILEALFQAELTSGSPKVALDVAEELQSLEKVSGGQDLGHFGFLSRAHLLTGNVAGAEKALGDAQSTYDSLRSSKGFAVFGDHWRGVLGASQTPFLRETGHYEQAEQVARQALAGEERAIPHYDRMAAFSRTTLFPRGQMERTVEFLRGELGLALLRQGRLVEAEVEFRRVLLNLLGRYGHYSPEVARAASGLALVLQEQGRAADAEILAKASVDIFENTGAGSASLAAALNAVASAQADREHWAEAGATFEKLANEVAVDGPTRNRFIEASLVYGLVQLKTGKAAQALAVMQRAAAARRQKLGERQYDTAEARGFLAMALVANGKRSEALAEFRAAVPILLQSSRHADDDDSNAGARDRRLQLVLESYMGLLADTEHTQEAAVESFRLADAARGQSVQRALAAASARTTVTDPALADLARREQDAQKQIGALEGLLSNVLGSPPDQQDAGAVQSLRARIDQLRTARATVREEIERRYPDYANLVDPRAATVEQARAALRPGEALLTTYVGADRTFVWALGKTVPVAFSAVQMGAAEIGASVKTLRLALDPNASTIGDIPAFDIGLANKLYAALLAPVASGWQNAGGLLVVPHRALGQLPFGLLVSEPTALRPDAAGQALFANYKSVPFLIRKVAITQLPSVASLTTLRSLPAGNAARKAFAGFGDPWFSPQEAAEARAEQAQPNQVADASALQVRGVRLKRRAVPKTESAASADLAQLPRLPETANEVRSIALALNADPSTDVFLGAQATERQVRTMSLVDRRVVMFATHGLVPGDLDGLTQPALALSSSSVATGGGDGLLTRDKILGLKLDADWVVLSACNTATGDGAGAEAISGLGRAFFYAGARAVLVTNWPVETESAKALTTDTFHRQATDAALGRAAALQQAMLGLIDGAGLVDAQKKTVFSYAHPIFWAPFSLVGDGGI